MWRALFLAVGIYCCLVGVQHVVIDRAVLKQGVAANIQDNPVLGISHTGNGSQVEVAPPEWAPWSLMAIGVIVILYSFSIPKRVRG